MHTPAALIYTKDAVSDRPKAVMLIFSACILELGFLWTGLMFARSGHDELRHSMKSHRALESGKRWMLKGFVVLLWLASLRNAGLDLDALGVLPEALHRVARLQRSLFSSLFTWRPLLRAS